MRSHLRVGLVLVVQVGILAAIPVRQVIARTSGTMITLKTRPVDPYDVLSGYYVTLGYEAENVHWKNGPLPNEGDTVYVVVQRGTPAWEAVSVQSTPEQETADRVSLRAMWVSRGWGDGTPRLTQATRLFVPETQRDDVTRDLRDAHTALVDLRVGADGTPAILRMRIGNKSWGE